MILLKIALTIIGCFGGIGAIVSATVKFTSEKIAERLEKIFALKEQIENVYLLEMLNIIMALTNKENLMKLRRNIVHIRI